MKQTIGDVTVSILYGGEGYSMPNNLLVEMALFTPDRTFILPSQAGLPKRYDRYWDGDEEYGGVAPYLSAAVALSLLTDLEKVYGVERLGRTAALVKAALDALDEEEEI